MGNQSFVGLFASSFALLTMFPEIGAYYKNRKNWVPINVPRIMPGDDYHHFSILNKLSISMSSPCKLFNCINGLARVTKMQLPGYFMLLPFYFIASLFFGKRCGISTVRFSCRFSFFFFGTNLYNETLIQLGFTEFSVLMSMVCCILFFITFPGVSRILQVQSVLFTGVRRSNLIRMGSYNELTRAFVMELSAPIFLFSSYVVIKIDFQSLAFRFFVTVFLIFLISSVYPPLAIVFVIFNSIEFYGQGFLFFSSIMLFTLISVATIGLIMRSDEVGREVFISLPVGGFFEFSLIGKRFFLDQALIFGFLFVTIPSKAPIFVLLGILMIGSFVKSHNLSRFWHRSGTFGFHLLLILGVGALLSELPKALQLCLFTCLCSYVVYFFCNTTIKTQSAGTFILPANLNLSEISKVDEMSTESTIIASSPERSFLYSLYGKKLQYWECYFFTNRNYLKNTARYVQSQRMIGRSDSQILSSFFTQDSNLLRFMVFYTPYNHSARQIINEKDLTILIDLIDPVDVAPNVVVY